MTIDVNLQQLNEEFLEDIDEIMEDTMVQLFVVHPMNQEEITAVQQSAALYNSIYYTVPYKLRDFASEKCLGFTLQCDDTIDSVSLQKKVFFIEEKELTTQLQIQLQNNSTEGIILHPTHEHPELENFFLCFTPTTLEYFDNESIATLSMDKLVLGSDYPAYGFETLYDTAKKISDIMFRPEQSIIARATKSTLELFKLR